MVNYLGVFAFFTAQALLLSPAASPLSSPPWRWDTKQRLDQRFDPIRAEARRRIAPQCVSGCGDSFVVDGRVNPELLMPSELMDTLAGAFVSRDVSVRETARATWVRRWGRSVDANFWTDLFTVGRPFFETWMQLDEWQAQIATRGATESDSATEVKLLDELCRHRFDALAAARQRFGVETFDEFLYKGIAPGVFISDSSPRRTDAERTEGGCR